MGIIGWWLSAHNGIFSIEQVSFFISGNHYQQVPQPSKGWYCWSFAVSQIYVLTWTHILWIWTMFNYWNRPWRWGRVSKRWWGYFMGWYVSCWWWNGWHCNWIVEVYNYLNFWLFISSNPRPGPSLENRPNHPWSPSLENPNPNLSFWVQIGPQITIYRHILNMLPTFKANIHQLEDELEWLVTVASPKILLFCMMSHDWCNSISEGHCTGLHHEILCTRYPHSSNSEK